MITGMKADREKQQYLEVATAVLMVSIISGDSGFKIYFSSKCKVSFLVERC